MQKKDIYVHWLKVSFLTCKCLSYRTEHNAIESPNGTKF